MSDSKRRVSGWEKGCECAEILGVGRKGYMLAGEDWECPRHQVFATMTSRGRLRPKISLQSQVGSMQGGTGVSYG